MYQVSIYHNHPEVVNGDMDYKTELTSTTNFKTRKEAKEWILGKIGAKSYEEVRQNWAKGVNTSFIYCFTPKTWIVENSGEKQQEFYLYTMKKVVV